MAQDFLDGMLVVMLPSMFTVVWLVWEQPSDLDFAIADCVDRHSRMTSVKPQIRGNPKSSPVFFRGR